MDSSIVFTIAVLASLGGYFGGILVGASKRRELAEIVEEQGTSIAMYRVQVEFLQTIIVNSEGCRDEFYSSEYDPIFSGG